MPVKKVGAERVVPIVIRVLGLPPGSFEQYAHIQLGIQRGKTEVLPPTNRDDNEIAFAFEVRAETKSAPRRLNFLGPYVQGPPSARFVYLSWSGMVGGKRQRFRRIKVPLESIRYSQVVHTLAVYGRIEGRISGIGPDGSPACATVPLLGKGWEAVP